MSMLHPLTSTLVVYSKYIVKPKPKSVRVLHK